MPPQVNQTDAFQVTDDCLDLSGAVSPDNIAAKVTLATALAHEKLWGARYTRVEIQGCGFAGAAFALQARREGREVRITDPRPFRLQRTSQRWLDPTMYLYPDSGWKEPWSLIPPGGGDDEPMTLERGMVRELVSSWDAMLGRAGLTPIKDANEPWSRSPRTLRVKATGTLPLNDQPEESYGTSLLKLGASFWNDRPGDQPGEYHVVGNGDGALQDALVILFGMHRLRDALQYLEVGNDDDLIGMVRENRTVVLHGEDPDTERTYRANRELINKVLGLRQKILEQTGSELRQEHHRLTNLGVHDEAKTVHLTFDQGRTIEIETQFFAPRLGSNVECDHTGKIIARRGAPAERRTYIYEWK